MVSPFKTINLLLFSSTKSLSLSVWPFSGGISASVLFSPAAAKCLSPKHSASNQCRQSGQLIFSIDLLTRDSSQITFLARNHPRERSALQPASVLTAAVIMLHTMIKERQAFI